MYGMLLSYPWPVSNKIQTLNYYEVGIYCMTKYGLRGKGNYGYKLHEEIYLEGQGNIKASTEGICILKTAKSESLCTYRLNWARRTSWGWWDEWDDTVLQTQDSKFEPWRSEAEHATSRSRRLPTILSFTRGWGRNILFLSNRRDREPNPELWRERQRC